MKPAIAFLISYAACLGLSCSGANEETGEEKHIAFEEAFILSEKITLPKKIFGDLSHLVRADNGDMIIFDMSQSRTWLYLEESYEWVEIVLEECHPGIDTFIIGTAFSDDHIFLINSPSLSVHSFFRDGSCGSRLKDNIPIPDFISGLSDGFLGYATRAGEYIPYLTRYDHSGNPIWEVAFENHPNPVFSHTVIGGGIAVSGDSLAIVTSSSAPESHKLDIQNGAFIGSKKTSFNEIFRGVNPDFDERAFKEDRWSWLREIGSHMIVAGTGLMSKDYLVFATPVMSPEENEGDYYLIYRLSDKAGFYTRIPEGNNWSGFISGGYIHEIHHTGEKIELHIYEINEESFP